MSGEVVKSRNMVSSSTGYCYSEVSSGGGNQNNNHHMLNGFESNSEIYTLTTGIEMIGFSKQPPDFSAGNLMVGPDSSPLWHDHNSRLMVGGDPSSSSSLRCVFTCEGNERPSQGLSLSLSSNNPSSIGLQSFELRQQQQQQQHQHDEDVSRASGIYGKSMNIILQQQQQQEDGFLGKAAHNNLHIHQHHHHHHHQQQQQQQQSQLFQIRNSKYLAPAQELLNETCNLGTKQNDQCPKIKLHKSSSHWQDESGSSSNTSSKKQSLYSLELLELQKRKTKLFQMLEEVDRRYKHYCDQMKAVVCSFEAVAGIGAATVYSALASKAMSRHFRCLRDGILSQIKATKGAMGEKDNNARPGGGGAAVPGSTRGETPRLRLLDQTIRRQRAFQQLSMMESHPWRPQRGLPERSVSVLRAWLFEHFLHPYPSDVDKHILARQTGLSRSQVSNWFINARVRLWKPMVEEMYVEEIKDQEDDDQIMGSSSNGAPDSDPLQEEHKPSSDQLVRIDSECLSSIINNNNNGDKNDSKNNTKRLHQDDQHQNHQPQHSFGRISDSFGAVELDFTSYNHHHPHHHHHQFFGGGGGGGVGGGGGGVSLTLGLQQNLGFSPATAQSSLFYPRDQIIEDCQTVQYSSILDDDDGEGENLPYRNLMGAQLLHDLTSSS